MLAIDPELAVSFRHDHTWDQFYQCLECLPVQRQGLHELRQHIGGDSGGVAGPQNISLYGDLFLPSRDTELEVECRRLTRMEDDVGRCGGLKARCVGSDLISSRRKERHTVIARCSRRGAPGEARLHILCLDVTVLDNGAGDIADKSRDFGRLTETCGNQEEEHKDTPSNGLHDFNTTHHGK